MAKKNPFKHEYSLHKITEKYLKELFDLEFMISEFQFNDLRPDTLAFDEKTKSFVIIEYKNRLDLNVLEQTKNYYDLLQNNREVYVNLYNDKFKTNLTVNDFNFDNTRAMIIGCEFTQEQIQRSENPDYPFELYIACLFEHDEKNGYITYEKVNGDYNKTIDIDLDSLKITQEDVLRNRSEEVIELYTIFKNNLLNEFDDLDITYLVDSISIKAQNEFLCIVNVKNSIKIHYYTKELDDYENKTRDISQITTGGPVAHYELTLTCDNVKYAIILIKQVYTQKVKK